MSISPDGARAVRWPPGALAVAASNGLAAILLTAAFVVWSGRYLPVVYNGYETGTVPRFAPGFLATGALEAAALVVTATTALVAGLAAVFAGRGPRPDLVARLLAVGASALVATAVPIAVLYAFLALLPLLAAAGVTGVAAWWHLRRVVAVVPAEPADPADRGPVRRFTGPVAPPTMRAWRGSTTTGGST